MVYLALTLLLALANAQSAQPASKPTAKPSPKVLSIEQMQAMLKDNPDQLKIREKLAHTYLKKEIFNKVIDLLNPYTEQISVGAQFDLASAYREKKDFLSEVRVLKNLTERHEDLYEGHYNLALAYLKLTNEAQGIESLRLAMQLNPKFKPAYDTMLALFIRADNRYEARELIQDMFKHFGERPEIMNDSCRLLSIDGFGKQAVNDCQKAILKSPNYADNYVYLAQSYQDTEQSGESEKTLIVAARKFPKSEFVQWATGQFYLKKQNYSVSEKYLAKAIQADATSFRAQVAFANANLELKQYEKSYQAFLTACKINPNTISDFQTAAAKLRQNKEDSLSRKFNQGTFACKR